MQIRLPNHARHRRRGVHLRQDDQHPVRLCRSALQSRRSTSGPASSPARSCACRSSTRTAQVIGVTQVLNKRGGPFTAEDESRLQGLHRADRDRARERQAVRRRPEHEELQREHAASMSNGVITLDEDGEHRHLQRRRPAHPARRRGRHPRTRRPRTSSSAPTPGCSTSSRKWSRPRRRDSH